MWFLSDTILLIIIDVCDFEKQNNKNVTLLVTFYIANIFTFTNIYMCWPIRKTECFCFKPKQFLQLQKSCVYISE